MPGDQGGEIGGAHDQSSLVVLSVFTASCPRANGPTSNLLEHHFGAAFTLMIPLIVFPWTKQ